MHSDFELTWIETAPFIIIGLTLVVASGLLLGAGIG
jgi:hypothetical protein